MQVGATFLPARGTATPDEAITRVPAGLSAYTAPAACRDSSTIGIGALKGLRPDGTATSDFRLASAAGATLFELAELQLKPVSRATAAPRPAAAALQAPQEMLYAVDWLASVAATPSATPAKHPTPGSWSIARSSEQPVQWQSGTAQSPSVTAGRQLQALQMHLRDGARNVVLHSKPAGTARQHPAATPALDNTAAASAMLRVAAQEHTAVVLQSFEHDPQASIVPAALPATDAFGNMQSAGLWRAPQLATASVAAADPSTSFPAAAASLNGTVLVTGGLGDIGMLIGLWIAKTRPSARVLLLSRTGRSQTLAAAAAGVVSPVTAVRCDVSSAEEVRALMSDLRTANAPPVQAVFHAGGVVQVCSNPANLAFDSPRCFG